MPFHEAVRLALQQIRVQKLKSFFTLLGVMIGVTFLIAVVSIVGGMSRYMTDQVVGKIMAVNSFELRHRPNINLGEMTEERWRELRRRPRIRETDVEPVAEALPADVKWAVVGNDNLSAQSRFFVRATFRSHIRSRAVIRRRRSPPAAPLSLSHTPRIQVPRSSLDPR